MRASCCVWGLFYAIRNTQQLPQISKLLLALMIRRIRGLFKIFAELSTVVHSYCVVIHRF